MKGIFEMFCNNCGKEIKENQKFCTNCGNSVSTERSENQELLNQELKEEVLEQDKKQDFAEKNQGVSSGVRTPNNRSQVNSRQFNKKQKLGA